MGFDLKYAFVIGDKGCDIALGNRLGAVRILVTTGYGMETLVESQVRPDFVGDSMAEAAEVIDHLLNADDACSRLPVETSRMV